MSGSQEGRLHFGKVTIEVKLVKTAFFVREKRFLALTQASTQHPNFKKFHAFRNWHHVIKPNFTTILNCCLYATRNISLSIPIKPKHAFFSFFFQRSMPY